MEIMTYLGPRNGKYPMEYFHSSQTVNPKFFTHSSKGMRDDFWVLRIISHLWNYQRGHLISNWKKLAQGKNEILEILKKLAQEKSKIFETVKKTLLNCLQLICSMLQPNFYPNSTCLHG